VERPRHLVALALTSASSYRAAGGARGAYPLSAAAHWLQLEGRRVKKYAKDDQRLLASWAADCAERVLPLFEAAYPDDSRPRAAIEVCRTWLRTGVFKMAEIRGASLAAHAAARAAADNPAACFAARAAGQAVATAHVPQHAFGGAYYALKALATAEPAQAEVRVAAEQQWQIQQIPASLRHEVVTRVSVHKRARGLHITIHKDQDF
jgi:hypothetical protein